ncbi:uncharacterized protein DEA37_0008249, partial [Paragonimus westermani]
DLARLGSTEVPSLKFVPTKGGFQTQPANYEYLYKSESAKVNRSRISGLKTIDNSSHKPTQSNDGSSKDHALSKPGTITNVLVNDSQCQTDFPVNFCSNPIYEHLSALTFTGGLIPEYSCQNDQQKSNTVQHKLAAAADKPSGASITTLAAVAAVAAATFLTQTINSQSIAKPNLKAVTNQSSARSDDDGITEYIPDVLFRILSASQKGLKPDHPKVSCTGILLQNSHNVF